MIYIGIALGILLTDLGIKYYIERHRSMQQEDYILKNRIILRKHHNKGITLNALDQHTKLVRNISVGMTVIIAVAALISCFGKYSRRTATWQKTGLAFVLGGALSNTYDRIFRHYVVDYFSFNVKWKRLRSIIFNIADLFIFIGSVLMSIGRKSPADMKK
ncbi:MAG: signal peptidase II [bacterium]|nr:signal peptidase II [bacterium]